MIGGFQYKLIFIHFYCDLGREQGYNFDMHFSLFRTSGLTESLGKYKEVLNLLNFRLYFIFNEVLYTVYNIF